MTAINSASPAIASDANTATSTHHPAPPRTGPLRSGNPRGDPNLAPRCGAKARTTGSPCRAPAMPNGRCRMHGGKSTGPRTPDGFAGLARARTTHGKYAQAGPQADQRAVFHHVRVFDRRARLNGAAFDLLPWLPPAFATRLRADTATELHAPALGARLQALLAADAPKPPDPPPAPATLPPPGDTPHPRRDARGRFAAPPPRLLRGRQAERAQARAEAAALAPWKLAIAQARTVMRQAQTAKNEKPRSDPAPPDAEKSAPAPAAPLPQTAQFGKLRIYPMNPETGPPCPTPSAQPARFADLQIYPMDPETALPSATPAEAANTSSAKTAIQRGTVAPPARPGAAAGEASAKTSIHSLPPGACPGGGTVTPPTTPAAAVDASCAKTAIHSLPPGACPDSGTMSPPAGPDAAAGEGSARTSIQRGTVTAGANPFRHALLASTVSNTSDAHQLAATVERAGGWPIIVASHAATQAGKDWRPAATVAPQRLADDANHQRIRVDPLRGPGLRLAPEADSVRTHAPGDP